MKLAGSLRLEAHKLPEATFQPYFHATHSTGALARIGEMRLKSGRLPTPALFPVFNMLTGPATHGLKQTGGIFKFLKRWVLLDDQHPCYLSEVLHFLDFHLSPVALDRWLPRDGSKTLHDWMDEWFREERRPVSASTLFADSGGFKLLFNSEVSTEQFGVRPTPQSILELQLRYGADIVASLDYPLPPNTPPAEDRSRTQKSRANALELMRLLETVQTDRIPFPYLAVHGQTPSAIRRYVRYLLERLHKEGFTRPFGLAIGSLVPRRSNYEIVVALIHAVKDEVQRNPSFDPMAIPIHVFGVTRDMIPVLAYLGVDTFDSSSHVQSARAMDYYDPETWRPLDFEKVDRLTCSCTACEQVKEQGLNNLQNIMGGEGFREHRNPKTGDMILKSQIYAWVAWHNLLLQFSDVRNAHDSILQGDLVEHVVRCGYARPSTKKLLAYLAGVDPKIAKRLEHMGSTVVPETVPARSSKEIGSYSLSYRPSDFDVMATRYRPTKRKSVLLLLPCASEKPYSMSRSHRLMKHFLKKVVGSERLAMIEKVSISGLYGPVPERFETLPEVSSYNYLLGSSAEDQIRLITERLAAFLQRHGRHFSLIVGYATGKAYRRVISEAFKLSGQGLLLPRHPRTVSLTEFARAENLDELGTALLDYWPAKI